MMKDDGGEQCKMRCNGDLQSSIASERGSRSLKVVEHNKAIVGDSAGTALHKVWHWPGFARQANEPVTTKGTKDHEGLCFEGFLRAPSWPWWLRFRLFGGIARGRSPSLMGLLYFPIISSPKKGMR